MFTTEDIFTVYNEQAYFLDKMSKLYQHNLLSYVGREAREYLSDKRKISSAMVKKFGIGYATNSEDLLDFITLNSFNEELLYKTGILKILHEEAYDPFYDRIMFPLMDLHNNVIGFSGRIWREGALSISKFVNSPDTEIYKKSLHLFGLNFAIDEIKAQGFVWLVEGIPDVIACHAAGITNAVSAGGTFITIEQLMILKYFTNNIALCMDKDTAGKKALEHVTPLLLSLKMNHTHIFLTDYKDPDELLREQGSAALQNSFKYPF